VNATERAALLEGVARYDELTAAVDERTFEIVDRRRRTAVIKGRGWLVRRMLLAADVIGISLAFLLAQLILGPGASAAGIALGTEYLLFLATLPGWVVLAKLYGLYDRDEERTDHSTADDLVGVLHLLTLGAWISFAGAWLTDLADPQLAKVVLFWALGITLVTLLRVAARAYCRRNLAYLQNAVIVGAGDVGQTIARKLLNHPEYGINLVGFVDSQPRERRDELEHLAILGSPERLPALVRLFEVERVIIAFSNDGHEPTLELIRSLRELEIQIDIVPRLYDLVSPGAGIHTVEGLPLVGLPPLRLSRSSRFLKRALDVTVAALGLVVLSPFLVLIALLIKLNSPGPVFFRQVRMGAHDRTFRIFKFRTMQADADERKAEVAHLNMHAQNGGDPRMFKIPDDPRATRVGRFLRRFSLDELPQLLNVLKGDMTLVGPRPLILDEDDEISTAWARKRLDLKPGVTGLWQVLGRSAIPFEEMVKLDYLYVTTWSLANDLRLMFRTLPALLHGEHGSASSEDLA
jgi:exopolysaccharide biosynthesis polyprenyl glycosylphosphotransferase